MSFLDALGLGTFWSKLKSYLTTNVVAPINICNFADMYENNSFESLYSKTYDSVNAADRIYLSYNAVLVPEKAISNLQITRSVADGFRIKATILEDNTKLSIRPARNLVLPNGTFTIVYKIVNNASSSIVRADISTTSTHNTLTSRPVLDLASTNQGEPIVVFKLTNSGFYGYLFNITLNSGSVDFTIKDIRVIPGNIPLDNLQFTQCLQTSQLLTYHAPIRNESNLIGVFVAKNKTWQRILRFRDLVTRITVSGVGYPIRCRQMNADVSIFLTYADAILNYDFLDINIKTCVSNGLARSYVYLNATRIGYSGSVKFRLTFDKAEVISKNLGDAYLEIYIDHGATVISSGGQNSVYVRPNAQVQCFDCFDLAIGDSPSDAVSIIEATATNISTDVSEAMNPS